MPIPYSSEYSRTKACMRCGFKAFFYALLPLSLHWSMVSYVNSSFLQQFFSDQMTSALYITGALIMLISFLHAGMLLNRFGAIRLITYFTAAELIALIGMAFTTVPFLALLFFVTHLAIVPLLVFVLDVIMEEMIGTQENSTGSKRGIYLTVSAFMGAFSTLCMGYLIGAEGSNFTFVYIASAVLLLLFFGIMYRNFRDFQDPVYPRLKVIESINTFWHHKDVRLVFFARFLLQIFFAWTVIYIPLYLATEMGYNWDQIGIILFIGLLAYVFFEYPIGRLADTHYGEKEMMILGFGILAIAVSWFAFLDNSSVVMWMTAMFMTRVGASFLETTTESYFFKHTKGEDVSTIGIYRIAQPLGIIIGSALGGILLLFIPFSQIFLAVGILMICGMFVALQIKDTL